MPRRILVLSASVGAGHLRAAQAIELALRQCDPTAVVRNVDVLELTNAAFRKVYGKSYLDLVNKAPHFLEPTDKTDLASFLVCVARCCSFVALTSLSTEGCSHGRQATT